MSQTTAAKYSDIRFIIAAALGLIGVFLLICAFCLDNTADLLKTDGINVNLWSGLGLSGVALVMGIWWKLSSSE